MSYRRLAHGLLPNGWELYGPQEGLIYHHQREVARIVQAVILGAVVVALMFLVLPYFSLG